MDTTFMKSENSKTFEPNRLLLNLADKTNLKRKDKYVPSSNLSMYYKLKTIKMLYKNNTFKATALTWNETFYLLDGSNFLSDIQYYFECILKKAWRKDR